MARKEHFELGKSRISSTDYKPAPRVFGNLMIIAMGTKDSFNALFGGFPGYEIVDIGVSKMTLRKIA